jgi:hypothetical protein
MHLDLRTDLPKIRAAFNTGELDPVVGHGRYCGPCAVGILLPQELRQKLDLGHGYKSIANILEAGQCGLAAPFEQHGDWSALQGAFDSSNKEQFDRCLTRLEATYAA